MCFHCFSDKARNTSPYLGIGVASAAILIAIIVSITAICLRKRHKSKLNCYIDGDEACLTIHSYHSKWFSNFVVFLRLLVFDIECSANFAHDEYWSKGLICA